MAKKSSSVNRLTRTSLPPEDYQTGLARAAAWASVRASEEDLAELADLLGDQDFQRALAVLSPVVQRDRDALVRDGAAMCARMDWQMRSMLFEGYFAIATALRQFLPERFETRAEEERRNLFVLWLIMWAHRHGEDPARTLHTFNTYEVVGPHAVRRLFMDADGHVGFLYGIIPIIQAAAEAQEPGAAQQLDEIVDLVAKLSLEHLPQRLMTQG